MRICYLDESGLDERSRSLVIGGFIAGSQQWARFEHEWRTTLAAYGVRQYHGRAMARLHFGVWPQSRVRAFHDDLLFLITSHRLVGFVVGVLRDDYQTVISSQPSPVPADMSPRQARHPFFFVFQYALIHAVEAARLPEGQHLVVVADEQRQYRAWACGIHDSLQNHTGWQQANRLGSLEFRSSADTPALQAADLLTSRARRELDRQVYAPSVPEDPISARLRCRVAVMKYYTAEAIRQRFENATFHRFRFPSASNPACSGLAQLRRARR